MENKKFRVLAINPGSTSTKIGIYDNEECIVEKTIRHDRAELDACGGPGVYKQKDLRRKLVMDTLAENSIELSSLDATVGRAARLPAMQSGTYAINDVLMNAIPDPLPSPALLGMVIAKELGDSLGIPSFIVDPANVDEFWEVSRVTGIPDITRKSSFHALNQKAVARRAAEELGKPYEETRLVVAHLGGGMSIGAHLYGKVVDATHGNDGEGSFTPERAGFTPGLQLVRLCFSGKYTQEELEGFFVRKGGMLKYLGTSDMRDVEKMIDEGNEQAALLFDAMCYNISKVIGSMFAALSCKADAVVLTGGITYSKRFCEKIISYIEPMGKILVYPGEDELMSMVSGALRVLRGQYEAQVFEYDK